MLLTDDGEREEGAGIRGVILWDKELERDTHRLGWGGSEDPRESRKGTDQERVSTLRSLWSSPGTKRSQRNFNLRNGLSIW